MDVIVHWLANLNGYFPSFGQLLLHPTHTPPICQTQTLYVFFGFYFCNNPRSSLPLIGYFWSASLGLKPTTFMHPAKTNFHLVVPHTNQTREGWVELCLSSHSIHFWRIRANIFIYVQFRPWIFWKVKLATTMVQMSPMLCTSTHLHLLWRLVQMNLEHNQHQIPFQHHHPYDHEIGWRSNVCPNSNDSSIMHG